MPHITYQFLEVWVLKYQLNEIPRNGLNGSLISSSQFPFFSPKQENQCSWPASHNWVSPCGAAISPLFSFLGNFSGGAVVENLPANAGDTGSTPGRGTKIPYASGQLSQCPTTMSHSSRACEPQILKLMCPRAHTQQLESSPCCTRLVGGSRAQGDRLQRESPELTAYSL